MFEQDKMNKEINSAEVDCCVNDTISLYLNCPYSHECHNLCIQAYLVAPNCRSRVTSLMVTSMACVNKSIRIALKKISKP